jgi:hypothetical protein
MRVLFLDIDGVLNSAEWLHLIFRMEEFGWKSPDSDMPKFRVSHLDPIKVDMITKLIEELNLCVVLSSTWRLGRTLEEAYEFFSRFGIPLIGFTPREHESHTRGDAIQMWLDQTLYTVEDFVILDDDSDMKHLTHRLVKTTWEKGLQTCHVELIRKMFNGYERPIYEMVPIDPIIQTIVKKLSDDVLTDLTDKEMDYDA